MFIDRIFGKNKWTIWVPTGPGDAEPLRPGLEFDSPALASAWAEANGYTLEI